MTSRKRTNANIDRIRTQIKKFVYEGIPDKEIIDTLAIPRRTFYTYKKKIIEQDKALSREISYLEMELVGLRNSLEYLYQTAMELSKQEDYNDRIGAAQAATDARLSQVPLLTEGPELIVDMQQQQVKYHKVGQSKIMMQAQPHP